MMWNKLLKGFNHIITGMLILALILTMALITISKVKKEESNLFGYQMKTVLSGSMEPDIKTGSIIFIKAKKDLHDYKFDDVITFTSEDGITVTHRIADVESNGERYITKGDANVGVDLNPVLSKDIIGEYTGFTIPYIGYIMNFVMSKFGAALLLIIPGVLLVFHSILIIRRVAQYINQISNDVKSESK